MIQKLKNLASYSCLQVTVWETDITQTYMSNNVGKLFF